MTARSSDSPADSARQAARDVGSVGAATTGVGAVVVTLVAGACCVSPVLAPLIVGVLGASGAVWAASLKPYTWYILAGSGAALAFGFWSVYRSREACALGEVPRRSRMLSRIAAIALWAGAVCWVGALVLRLALPQF
jgi:hypothetical protein